MTAFVRRPTLALVAALIAASTIAFVTGIHTSVATAAAGEPSRFVPVGPCRLVDTRETGQRLAAGGRIEVPVTGDRCGVPADATAAALVITVARPAASGFVTVWPSGAAQPTTSVLNYRRDEFVPASQLVRLGVDGGVSLSSLAAADLLVDVTGYFVPQAGSVHAGRFVAVEPDRLVDSRETTRPSAGGVVRVATGVPDDAIAVSVNIATAASSGPGFFTAYAAGSARPTASVLNTDGAGQTRASAAIVPVTAGAFEVYTSAGDHVIVDITGYVTGASAERSSDGLFVPSDPVRLVDTRQPAGAPGGPRLWDGGAREFSVTSITGGPVAAIAANVTMTATEDAGFVVGGAARTAPSGTSSVNADGAERTVANSAIVPVSTAGVAFTTLESTHLVVDVTGWFTGDPVPTSTGAAVNTPNPDRRVFIIADSTMAGMRWNGTLAGLQGFTLVHKLESCRRLVAPSCRGREGYRPPTVLDELRDLTGITKEDILLIGAGYDDDLFRFSGDVDTIVGAARQAGFHHIAWATYVVSTRYLQPGALTPNFAAMNDVLATKVASGRFPEVRIWDLNTYVTGTVGWFNSDGIHETTLGSWGVADWISRHVRAFDDRPCVQPWAAGGVVADPCPNPDRLPATLGHPQIQSLYPVAL